MQIRILIRRCAQFALLLLFCSRAWATAAPVCLAQDVLSGQVSGGEGGAGIYVRLFGQNFTGVTAATVNGTNAAQIFTPGPDPTTNWQELGIQVPSGITGTGAIVLTTPGGSCQFSTANLTACSVSSGVATLTYTGPQVVTGQSAFIQGFQTSACAPLNGYPIAVQSGSTSTTFTATVPTSIPNVSTTSDTGTFSNGGFTVRSGSIWFIGSGTDNTAPASTCTAILNTGGDGVNPNSYTNPWGMTNLSNVDMYVTNARIAGGSGYTTAQNNTTYTSSNASCTTLTFNLAVSGGACIALSASGTTGACNVGDYIYPTPASDPSGTGCTFQLTGVDKNSYTYSTQKTPETYYKCISTGDTLVFLNGANFTQGSGVSGYHGSLVLNRGIGSQSNRTIYETRPGASVALGGNNTTSFGINAGTPTTPDIWYTVTGFNLIGSNLGNAIDIANGNVNAVPGVGPISGADVVGNTVTCPTCNGTNGAISGGVEGSKGQTTGGVPIPAWNRILFNDVSNMGCSAPASYGQVAGRGVKETQFIYLSGDDSEVGWNRIHGGCSTNGIQHNFYDDGEYGYTNVADHDNDVADTNGNGIVWTTIDPSRGYVKAWNNILHHTGVGPASDQPTDEMCFYSSGQAPQQANPGTANFFNNTLYDCSAYLGTAGSYYSTSGAIWVSKGQVSTPQSNLTVNLTNNVIYQPSYTWSSSATYLLLYQNGLMTGSNNMWYTATACPTGCTTTPLTIGTIQNPQFVNAADGPYTNFLPQSGSPLLGAATESLIPPMDFAALVRPSSGAIGALEMSGSPYLLSTSVFPLGSGTLVCTPSGSITSGVTVNCTATAGTGYTFGSFSTNSCGFTATANATTGTMPAYPCSLTASNTANNYTLTVTPPTNGTIGGPNCATGSLPYATSITCQAYPAGGYLFSGWSGGTLSGTTNPQTFLMGAGAATVTAGFSQPTALKGIM